jgi:CHAT domain-containing protein
LLSGLAMTGANRGRAGTAADPDADDGILTAEEIGTMNLDGAGLVILSACETGLGQTAGGEGLLGLQRAFQSAGARTVVATLWSVPDDETRALMEDFYTNLWQRKLSPLESLRRAQLDMLARPTRAGRNRGLEFEDRPLAAPSGKRSPYYWAAFVLSGDWR